MTHGPLAEKNYKRKISKKMRAQALFSVLSKKLKDEEIIFIDTLAMSEIKTKKAQEVMKNLAKVYGKTQMTTATHESAMRRTHMSNYSEDYDAADYAFRKVERPS